MIFENDLECFGVYISVDLCQDSRVKCHLISHTANTEQSRSRDRTRNPLPGPARANAAPESRKAQAQAGTVNPAFSPSPATWRPPQRRHGSPPNLEPANQPNQARKQAEAPIYVYEV